jgi:predicted Zn-ribbon and HTH transcriptional regulator
MAPRTCRICGRTDLSWAWVSQGRCPMCHLYWRRHGGDRAATPPRAVRPLRPCQTCGQPVQEVQRGRCPACYKYWRRTGRERPRYLWPHQTAPALTG